MIRGRNYLAAARTIFKLNSQSAIYSVRFCFVFNRKKVFRSQRRNCFIFHQNCFWSGIAALYAFTLGNKKICQKCSLNPISLDLFQRFTRNATQRLKLLRRNGFSRMLLNENIQLFSRIFRSLRHQHSAEDAVLACRF